MTLENIKDVPGEKEAFGELVKILRYLRSPQGCPWDREQSAEQFTRYAIEEAEELLDAFKKDDRDNIEEEWGDTFFVLLAVAVALEQEGWVFPGKSHDACF